MEQAGRQAAGGGGKRRQTATGVGEERKMAVKRRVVLDGVEKENSCLPAFSWFTKDKELVCNLICLKSDYSRYTTDTTIEHENVCCY